MQNGVGQIHNFNHIDKNGGWIYTKLLPVTDGPSGLRVKAVGSRNPEAVQHALQETGITLGPPSFLLQAYHSPDVTLF